MKKIIILFILLLPLISALQITEVELNPAGTDAGNEWIEFYSEQEINLSEYIIINHDPKELIINQFFQGYFIYTFSKQWLDNSNESIFLYKNNQLIQKTPTLQDTENNEKTWQFCNKEWIFQEQTKNKKNCEEEIIKEEQEEQEEQEKSSPIKKEIINFTPIQPIIKETIQLNPKTIKTDKSKETIGKKNYAKYSIIIFCILLLFLYMIKPRKKKNEWQ